MSCWLKYNKFILFVLFLLYQETLKKTEEDYKKQLEDLRLEHESAIANLTVEHDQQLEVFKLNLSLLGPFLP